MTVECPDYNDKVLEKTVEHRIYFEITKLCMKCEFSKDYVTFANESNQKIKEKVIHEKSKKMLEDYTLRELKDEIDYLQKFRKKLDEKPEKTQEGKHQTSLDRLREEILTTLEWYGLRRSAYAKLIAIYERYVEILEKNITKSDN